MRLKDHWRERRPEIISGLCYRFVSLMGRTLRPQTRGFENIPPRTIYCGWHSQTFPFSTHFRDRGWWVIISQSRDGDIQNLIFERLGYRVARGSTGRGGERAAVRSIKAIREGGVMAMTPDGPRGPARVVQPGVLLIAQRAGATLVPVGVAIRPGWRIERSWDRYVVPRPFSRSLMVAGEGMTVPKDAPPEEFEAIRLRLESAISEMQALVEREIDG